MYVQRSWTEDNLGLASFEEPKLIVQSRFLQKIPEKQRDVICEVNLEFFMLLTFQTPYVPNSGEHSSIWG